MQPFRQNGDRFTNATSDGTDEEFPSRSGCRCPTASACFSDKRDKLQPFSGVRGFGVVVGTLANFIICRRPAAILSRASDRPDAQPRSDCQVKNRCTMKVQCGTQTSVGCRPGPCRTPSSEAPPCSRLGGNNPGFQVQGGGQPLMPRSRRWCENDCAASSCRHHKGRPERGLRRYHTPRHHQNGDGFSCSI